MIIVLVILTWLALGFIGHLLGCKYFLKSDWKEGSDVAPLIILGPLNILAVGLVIITKGR